MVRVRTVQSFFQRISVLLGLTAVTIITVHFARTPAPDEIGNEDSSALEAAAGSVRQAETRARTQSGGDLSEIEPNDTFENANAISPNTVISGLTDLGYPDMFRIDTRGEHGKTMTIRLEGDWSRMQICDDRREPIFDSETDDASRDREFTTGIDGEAYFVRMTSLAGGTMRYTISVSTRE